MREGCTPSSHHPQAAPAIGQDHEVSQKLHPGLVCRIDVNPAVVAVAAGSARSAIRLRVGHGEL
jgi:hypothetical protein